MRKGLFAQGTIGLGAALVVAACGGGGGNGGGGGPVGAPASVAGLVVVHDDVARRDPTAVGEAPDDWLGRGTTTASAALAHADWTIADAGLRGTTAADGTFEIEGLAPGRHVLELTRTLGGDLVQARLPFGVGDDGGAMVLAEIAWGATRAQSTYALDGRAVDAVFAPNEVHVVVEDGLLVELGDGVRVWRDEDRDGDFDTCTVVREAATCVVAQIGTILTTIPETLRVDAQANARAIMTLSDGSALDVTYVATWRSSSESVATVDSFGRITAHAPGETEIQARIGNLGSLLTTLQVVERAALTRISVQNASCYLPYASGGDDLPIPGPVTPPSDQGVWAPSCRQVVEIGGTLWFVAIGEYADGDVQDVTAQAAWTVEPAEIGDVAPTGLFTGRAAGSASVRASLDGVESEPTEVRVVTEPTLVAIYVHAEDGGIGLPGPVADPAEAATDLPCIGCGGFALTVLRGDTVPLRANGEYDTGAFRDLTDVATWTSTHSGVANVSVGGALTAVAAGDAQVTASFAGITSAPGQIRVVDDATLQHLWIHQVGERVVARGDQRFFSATGSYDVGFSRDVTSAAVWRTSDPAVARFDEPGVLTGVAAGDVEVWAELDGVASQRERLEVFETSELDYCDPDDVNRGTWTDGFNRVLLESDCATYTQPGVATLRFTVSERTSPGGIFDPCLDLYVFQGERKVRTIREEGCGEPFAPNPSAGLEDEILKYQVRAFWDLKDDAGAPVAPGEYQIYGRFYLYYDPVVSLTVTIE